MKNGMFEHKRPFERRETIGAKNLPSVRENTVSPKKMVASFQHFQGRGISSSVKLVR